LMIITKGGVVMRQKINTIRETGRVAQGVKLINLDAGDKVAAVAKLVHDEEDGDDENGEEAESNAEDLALGVG
jgi:DNA gyrase subunit A